MSSGRDAHPIAASQGVLRQGMAGVGADLSPCATSVRIGPDVPNLVPIATGLDLDQF